MRAVLTAVFLLATWAGAECVSGSYSVAVDVMETCSYGQCGGVLCSETELCGNVDYSYTDSYGYTYFDCENALKGTVVCANTNKGCELLINRGKKANCKIRCTGRSVDSLQCVSDGKTWVSSSGTCSDLCGAEKNVCAQYGGKWTPGSPSSETCTGLCDLCGGEPFQESLRKLRERCCASGVGVSGLSGCFNPAPPWTSANFSDFEEALICNQGTSAQFDSWCLANAGTDTTQSSSSRTPDCFGAGCSSSASESSSSGGGEGSSGSGESSSSGGGGGSSGSGESSSSGGGGGSSGSGESSSGSEESSSQSGGGGGGNGDTVYVGNGEDWEYNYYPEFDSLIKYGWLIWNRLYRLEDIDETTEAIRDSLGMNNSLAREILKTLGEINGKDFTVNVGGDSLSVDVWNGDSAIGGLWDSISGLWDNLTDTAGFGAEYGSDTAEAFARLDSSLAWYDSGFGIGSGTVDSLGSSLGGQIAGLVDSGAIGSYVDSVTNAFGLFDYKRFSGNGGCPAFLTEKRTVKIGGASVEMDGVGDLLCTSKIALFGRSPWEVGRSIIRAVVAILCGLYLFKTAMGAGGSDDD